MAKRVKPMRTRSQLRRQKRLQHYNNSPHLAQRPTHNLKNWVKDERGTKNYSKLGIAVDANEAVSDRSLAQPKRGTMTSYLEKIQALPPGKRYEVKSMNIQEQYILQDLVRKYGDDYEKMARDIKINVYQQTARQLEKRIALMTRLFEQAEEAERAAEEAAMAEADKEEEEDAEEDLEIAREAEAEMLEQIRNDPEFLKLIGEDPKLTKKAKSASPVTNTIEAFQRQLLAGIKRDAARAQRKMEAAVKQAIEEEKRGPVEILASGDTVAITGEKLIEHKGSRNRGSRAWKSGGDMRLKYTGNRIYKVLAPRLIRILPAVESQRRKFFKNPQTL